MWKVSKYGFFSGLYFPVFGLNTEIYRVNLRIQSKYRKIRTRKNSAFGHFLRSAIYLFKIFFSLFQIWAGMELWWAHVSQFFPVYSCFLLFSWPYCSINSSIFQISNSSFIFILQYHANLRSQNTEFRMFTKPLSNP